jgi:hypothetical protein
VDLKFASQSSEIRRGPREECAELLRESGTSRAVATSGSPSGWAGQSSRA